MAHRLRAAAVHANRYILHALQPLGTRLGRGRRKSKLETNKKKYLKNTSSILFQCKSACLGDWTFGEFLHSERSRLASSVFGSTILFAYVNVCCVARIALFILGWQTPVSCNLVTQPNKHFISSNLAARRPTKPPKKKTKG